MIGVSKLLLAAASESDGLRYNDVAQEGPDQIKYHKGHVKSNKPIVVWNMTNMCNLKCVHCYASAKTKPAEGELSTEEAKKFIDDVAEYNCPVLLFFWLSPNRPLPITRLYQYLIQYASR